MEKRRERVDAQLESARRRIHATLNPKPLTIRAARIKSLIRSVR